MQLISYSWFSVRKGLQLYKIQHTITWIVYTLHKRKDEEHTFSSMQIIWMKKNYYSYEKFFTHIMNEKNSIITNSNKPKILTSLFILSMWCFGFLQESKGVLGVPDIFNMKYFLNWNKIKHWYYECINDK